MEATSVFKDVRRALNPFRTRTQNESCAGCEQVVHSIVPTAYLVIWSAHGIEYELLASVDSAQNDRLNHIGSVSAVAQARSYVWSHMTTVS